MLFRSASSGIREIARISAEHWAKKLPQMALTKTAWYPIVKKIAEWLGIKITKDSVGRIVERRARSRRLKPRAHASPYAPHLLEREEAQRFMALFGRGDDAAFAIARVGLGIAARHLRQRARRRDAEAHGDARPPLHLAAERLAPRLDTTTGS